MIIVILLLLLLLSTNLYSAPNTPLTSGTLHTKHEHNTKTNAFNPLDAGRRYTGFAQTSKWRQTPVYRVCANFSTSPEPGIPGLRKHISLARPRYTGFIF